MKVTFKVFRFNAETDYLPHYDTIEMDVKEDEVVLDILNRIKWEHDGSFSYRRSCRHGICGSCAVKVNGRSTLACKERMVDMIELFGNELTIEPVSKKRAVKDMVVDKADFWKKYETVKPWLEAEIDEHPAMENIIPPKEAEKLEEADYCIQCGCCYYACPVVEVNEDYLGPAAFEKAYRFTADVRDNAKKERLEIVDILGQGVWDCVKCYECAEACPKEIDPIGKITKLHNQIFEEGVAKSNVATRHAVGFKRSIKKHGILDEGDLVLYSEGFGVVKHMHEAFEMFKKGKIVLPWNMPKSKNLDEIQKLIKSSSTVKF
ncbi:succinate dehydrogenase/fumarate reductase iron-sulfur subunit [Nitratiruptor sp. SB155-2]|uniref:succinate dehydrogenase/fumarate reductase iron-sulfur subunit n=1 Tax=Nitratiruptor sp. (strain SB155-2) TaxID=387092 RepID=UPI000158724E|nr:succinate dehydrogenase/fumarate reductase iron-sulfur subunit [Nitratiruptor sp. SB155-2]BAF69803.1 succinate dehydrogenase/fumarate reductase, iron-sulfur protein [Nitratiruptor sp. SB155-2]